MNFNTLPAHLTRPEVGSRLPRTALRRQLREVMELAASRLIWIHGGPGWGKTTFAAQFCAQHEGAVVWLRLDESDADPAALLAHLQQALHAAVSATSAAIPALSREQLAAPAAQLRTCCRALFDALPHGSLLVLDEVQRAGSDRHVSLWLELLLDECRAGQRLIALSRRAAPEALAGHILSAALVQWPARRLALTHEELAPWLSARGAAVSRLPAWFERHHGWPAALLTLTRELPDNAAGLALAAFIDHQVLEAMPAPVQALLGACAWLPVIEPDALPSLGVQITAAQASAQLDTLVQDGALIDSLPAKPDTKRWRVHELLRERLRARLVANEPGAAVAQRMHDSARWLLANGQADAAMACLFEAAVIEPVHWHGVNEALQAVAPAWLAQRRQHSLRDAAQRIPEASRSAGTWWCLAQAQAPFDPASARACAERALALFPHDAKTERLRCLALIIASYFQAFDSTTPLAHWMAQLEQLGLDPDKIDAEQRSALAVGVWSALFLRDPLHLAHRAWQRRVQAVPTSPVNPDTRIRAAMLLAKQAWYNGGHQHILPLAAQVEGVLAEPALSPYSRLVWCLLRQYEAWGRADWPAGLAAADEGLDFACSSGIHLLDQHLRLHAACFSALLGDTARADRWLADVARQADPVRPMEAWHHHAVRGWLMLRSGRPAEAEAASTLAIEAADAMGPAPRAMAMAVRCHALRALGRDAEAQRSLLDLEHTAASGNQFAAVHVALLRADLALAIGNPLAALSALTKAFTIVRTQGLHAIFGIAPDCMARLAVAALNNAIESADVVNLIRSQRLEPPPLAGEHWPWPVRVRTLGCFRLDIDGRPLRHEAKAPRRPLELLQALIARGGRAPVAWLADALWPQSEGDHANDAFEVALRRLRKLLGHGDALRLSAGELSIEPGLMWVDALHWRALAEQAGDAGLATHGWSAEDFLPDVDAAWVYPARAQLAALRRRASASPQARMPRGADVGTGLPSA